MSPHREDDTSPHDMAAVQAAVQATVQATVQTADKAADRAVQLPADFADKALAQFDRLRAEGRLFYSPTAGEVVEHDGFWFEFRASPSIARKPVLAVDAPERRGVGGPFVDPDPAFVVGRPGPDHVVELSMHAMMRPHYVLHTRLFAPQTDDLDRADWAATWALMRALPAAQTPMMIYNCGYEGGASQGHKHVQVFAAPDPGFPLFPQVALDRAGCAASDDPVQHPGVPFQHFVLPLPPDAGPDALLAVYRRLLAAVRRAHREHAAARMARAMKSNGAKEADIDGMDGTDGHATPCADDHSPSTTANNVIATPTWMCMIPRRRGGKDGTGAGSLGMLGLLWLKGPAERAHWNELGMTKHLVWMGLPR